MYLRNSRTYNTVTYTRGGYTIVVFYAKMSFRRLPSDDIGKDHLITSTRYCFSINLTLVITPTFTTTTPTSMINTTLVPTIPSRNVSLKL